MNNNNNDYNKHRKSGNPSLMDQSSMKPLQPGDYMEWKGKNWICIDTFDMIVCLDDFEGWFWGQSDDKSSI